MTSTNTETHNNNKELMGGIISLRDDLFNDAVAPSLSYQDDLSESFARLDPDLMALYKDMKDAHALLVHTKNGGELNDTAKWRFESAESAYKTRMMEVRSAKFKMASDEEKREALAKREMHETAMQDRMNEQFAALRKRQMEEKKQQQSSGSWFFYFMLGLWLSQMHTQRLRLDKERDMAQNAFNKVHAA
jgi:hypothetical protein